MRLVNVDGDTVTYEDSAGRTLTVAPAMLGEWLGVQADGPALDFSMVVRPVDRGEVLIRNITWKVGP